MVKAKLGFLLTTVSLAITATAHASFSICVGTRYTPGHVTCGYQLWNDRSYNSADYETCTSDLKVPWLPGQNGWSVMVSNPSVMHVLNLRFNFYEEVIVNVYCAYKASTLQELGIALGCNSNDPTWCQDSSAWQE